MSEHGLERVRLGPTLFAGAAALAAGLPLAYLVVRSLALGWGPYGALASDLAFLRGVAGSTLLATVIAFGGVLVASMAGYVMAVHRGLGGGWVVPALAAGIVAVASLPPQLLLPGGGEVVTRLGMFDSYWAVVLPASLNLLGVLLYRAAFLAVPLGLIDAARVDGCSEWGVYFRIAMPAVRPTTAACVMLSFAAAWNAVIWPTLVLHSPERQLLSQYVTLLAGTAATQAEQTAVLAATVLAIAPILLLFLLLQRDFLPPLRGAVKE